MPSPPEASFFHKGFLCFKSGERFSGQTNLQRSMQKRKVSSGKKSKTFAEPLGDVFPALAFSVVGMAEMHAPLPGTVCRL